ncbi:MAG: acylphosphatase [Beijerinckiaceae bacterium]|nr:acylphosphatase [Beijerinckiaceae bacterium]
MSERALHVRVTGRVQGVNYRNFTVTAARGLAVEGWVRNCEDGSVEAALRGPGQALSDLIGIMRKGPPQGQVDDLEVRSADHGAAAEPPRVAYVF